MLSVELGSGSDPQAPQMMLNCRSHVKLSQTPEISYEVVTHESPSIFALTGENSIISIKMKKKRKEKQKKTQKTEEHVDKVNCCCRLVAPSCGQSCHSQR